jgi:transcriptional regulator with XRE-family HTH domain
MKKRTKLQIAVFMDGRKMADIAKACGTTPTYFSEIYNGKRKVRIDRAILIAGVLGLQPEDLFNE